MSKSKPKFQRRNFDSGVESTRKVVTLPSTLEPTCKPTPQPPTVAASDEMLRKKKRRLGGFSSEKCLNFGAGFEREEYKEVTPPKKMMKASVLTHISYCPDIVSPPSPPQPTPPNPKPAPAESKCEGKKSTTVTTRVLEDGKCSINEDEDMLYIETSEMFEDDFEVKPVNSTLNKAPKTNIGMRLRVRGNSLDSCFNHASSPPRRSASQRRLARRSPSPATIMPLTTDNVKRYEHQLASSCYNVDDNNKSGELFRMKGTRVPKRCKSVEPVLVAGPKRSYEPEHVSFSRPQQHQQRHHVRWEEDDNAAQDYYYCQHHNNNQQQRYQRHTESRKTEEDCERFRRPVPFVEQIKFDGRSRYYRSSSSGGGNKDTTGSHSRHQHNDYYHYHNQFSSTYHDQQQQQQQQHRTPTEGPENDEDYYEHYQSYNGRKRRNVSPVPEPPKRMRRHHSSSAEFYNQYKDRTYSWPRPRPTTTSPKTTVVIRHHRRPSPVFEVKRAEGRSSTVASLSSNRHTNTKHKRCNTTSFLEESAPKHHNKHNQPPEMNKEIDIKDLASQFLQYGTKLMNTDNKSEKFSSDYH